MCYTQVKLLYLIVTTTRGQNLAGSCKPFRKPVESDSEGLTRTRIMDTSSKQSAL